MKDSIDFSTYFDNLDSLIEDEKKPVTYRWFAIEFCLQVNVSKKVLEAYYEKYHLKEKRPLCAKYCIGGVLSNCLPDVEQIGISVVDEDELKNAREKFSKVTFEHIYSLSKTKVAMENLTAIDMMQQKEHQHSINKYSNLRNSSVHISSGEVTHLPPSISDPNKSSGTDVKSTKALPSEDREPKLDTAKLKKVNKGSLAAAFTQQSSAKDIKQENSKPENGHAKEKANKIEDKKGSNAKKGISNYFTGKAVDKAPPTRAKSPPVVDTPAATTSTDEDVAYADKKPAKRFKVSQSPPPKTEPENEDGVVAKKVSHKGSKLSHKEKQSKEKKKSEAKKGQKLRRRIQQVSDSESEPERELEEDEPMETASPEKPAAFDDSSDDEIIPPTPKPAVSSKSGRKRVLKEVSRTFMDESGYVVTKKEYEAQSESDEEPVTVEETPPPAAERKVPAPRVASPPLKRKQASILSFFGKKS